MVEKLGDTPVAYRLKLLAHFRIHDGYHVSLLKPYDTNGSYSPPLPALMDGQEEFEVAEILTHKPQGKTSNGPASRKNGCKLAICLQLL